VHRENGRTDYTDPLDLKKVVDDRFVTKAIETLAPVQ
jgi:NitT/TauT family transport system substrate-binding protein